MKKTILFALCFLLYGLSAFGGFVQDDRITILNNYQEVGVSSFFTVWTRPYFQGNSEAGAYRPLTSLSFDLNKIILGKAAWGYHLVNVVLYGSLCVMVFEMLLMYGWSEKLAFWTSLIFLVHPIHTEAVANISGRSEVLSFLLAIMALTYLKRNKTGWALLCWFGAMVSKESGIMWLIPLFYVLWLSKRKQEEKVVMAVYGFLVMGIYALLRWSVLGGFFGSNIATMIENPLKFVSNGERMINAVALVGFGIGKLFFPLKLSYDYSFNQIKMVDSLIDARFFLVVLWMCFCGVLAWKDRTNEKIWLMLMLFFVPLIMTSNILMPIGTIFAERLWLAPSLGFVGLGMLLFDRLKWSKKKYLLIMLVVLLGLRTFVRTFDWLSEERLFIHDAAYVNESVIAKSNEAAMWVLSRNYENSLMALQKASQIYPSYPQLMNNRGMYFLSQGKIAEAKKKFEECVAKHPTYGLCISNFGLVK